MMYYAAAQARIPRYWRGVTMKKILSSLMLAVFLFALTSTSLAQSLQPSELTALDGSPSDSFGFALAVSGGTMVIGARFHGGTGAAYVFTESNHVWTQVAELSGSDVQTGWSFGFSVGVSGNAVVVGALGCCDGSNTGKGAAYVFVKPANGWTNMTETAKLTASDEAVPDFFSYSVGVSDNTIVVGAPLHFVLGNEAQGAAYIFTKPAQGWTSMTQTAELTASDGAAEDQFGISVAVEGSTVVAGAYLAKIGSITPGTGYVFLKPSGGWTDTSEVAKLTTTDAHDLDEFGASVAISGDELTVVVGSVTHPGKSGSQGAAYVFTKPATGWQSGTQNSEFLAPANASAFYPVAINGLGTIIVVGAPDTGSSAGRDVGTAFVYQKPSTGWAVTPQPSARLYPPSPQRLGFFGRIVAVRGGTVVVGEDGKNNGQGAAYVFEPR